MGAWRWLCGRTAMASIVRSPLPFAPPSISSKFLATGGVDLNALLTHPLSRAKTRLSPSARGVPGIRSCSFFFRGGLFSLNRARV